MRRLRPLGILFLSFLLGPQPFLPAAQAASHTNPKLILPVEAVRPGDTFLAGIELAMQPGWHTYWRHGGDSGAPTTVDWKLPAGVTAGPIRWPAPERFAEADLVTFVYHGTVTLIVPISVAATVPAGSIDLAANLRWLECKESCIPGRGSIEGRLVIGPESRPSPQSKAVELAAQQLPLPLPPEAASAAWDGPPTLEERPLVIRWHAPPGPGSPEFFPDGAQAFEVRTLTDRLPGSTGEVVLRKKVRKLEGDWPRQLTGVLALLDTGGKPLTAFEASLGLTEAARGESTAPPGPPQPTPNAPIGPSLEAAPSAASQPVSVPSLSLGRALLLGLLGGIILNIMPCVLPVIALKILGFVRQSGSRPAEIRRLGLIYGLGVWISFLVLAAVVIGVKQAVGIASWGMQFGNPVFLVSMTTLVLLVALSLFGVYEINVGGSALDAAGDLASKEGPAGAFFNGMLAVALATPCTAPFLAPALGYAFAAAPITIVLVFSAIAAGLASPYILLSWQPAWLRFLPKPGAWMERFKIAMGFPMLATALWLYTLAGGRFGASGPLWLGLFLVGLALAAWVWGEFVQRARRSQGLGRIAAVLIALGFYAYALEKELDWRHPASRTETPGAPSTSRHQGGIAWQPWSRAAVDAARSQGHAVFVDFTADWCLTCELNARSSIEIPEVRAKLVAEGIVALKGDYTDLPRNITEELQRFGRAGVPLVIVFPRDPTQAPIVLPELLTPSIVVEALAKATR